MVMYKSSLSLLYCNASVGEIMGKIIFGVFLDQYGWYYNIRTRTFYVDSRTRRFFSLVSS